ncbi:Peptidyl-prolyl cis-trans isomerase CYP23-like protein [Drosera capensis]
MSKKTMFAGEQKATGDDRRRRISNTHLLVGILLLLHHHRPFIFLLLIFLAGPASRIRPRRLPVSFSSFNWWEKKNYGDIEFGFYPNVAPKTVDHIFKLVRLGCYNTNHFFRVDNALLQLTYLHSPLDLCDLSTVELLCSLKVDRGFVAQVADVGGGRTAPMNDEKREEAEKTVVGEFSEVKHVRGILSMGRYQTIPDFFIPFPKHRIRWFV